MCRIAGFIDFKYRGSYDIEKVVSSMRDTMTYGGPDDAGNYVEKDFGLALGHRRLSILDLSSAGHQPMANEDGNLWITYNGEVYNFLEIRKDLEQTGCRFRSNTDTEVILKAYERWGIDAVHKFRGMWAFAIWNKKDQKLILCRDRVGVKPLYWYFKEGLFLFSSELKAFHEHPGFHKAIDPRALSLFLQQGYITAPFSIFQFTHKLEPGHYLEIDPEQQIQDRIYWKTEDLYRKGLGEREAWCKRSEEEITRELEKVLTESFNLRLVADVPVGVFLSGGIDSSLVTALLQKSSSQRMKTFTIGFHEQGYDEAPWARRVAEHLGTDHTEHYCTPQEVYDVILRLPELYDEPFGDSSAIPTYLVSRLAKQKVKVSLSADGGDELFCGYTRYWMFPELIRRIHSLPRFVRHFLSIVTRSLSPDKAVSFYERTKYFFPKFSNVRDKYAKFRAILNESMIGNDFLSFSSIFRKEDLASLGIPEAYGLDFKKGSFLKSDPLTSSMYEDLGMYLPDDILTKVDRATMAVSLEGREPFLDPRILEFAAALPLKYKYQTGASKYILKKILYKYVPRELVERPKQGFGVPVFQWFRSEMKHLLFDYLNEARICREGVLNSRYVGNLLELYFNGKDVDPYKLWYLFSFQMWKERWKV